MASVPTFERTWTHRVDQHTVNSHVIGGPTMQSANNRPFTVDHIVARWTRTDAGPWLLDWLTLTGPRLLKSGKASTGPRESAYHLSLTQADERPRWVNDWLTANKPKANSKSHNERDAESDRREHQP